MIWMAQLGLLLLGGWFLYDCWKQIQTSLDEKQRTVRRCRTVTSWGRAEGSVVKLAHGIDYLGMKEIDQPDFEERYQRLVNMVQQFAGLWIGYRYTVDGADYESRMISPIEGSADLHMDLFYRLNVGDSVNAYVNKEAPQQAVLICPSNEEIDKHFAGLMWERAARPGLRGVIAIWASVIWYVLA